MELKERITDFESRIYYFILKRVKDSERAKDILQNVNLKALENSAQIRDQEKTSAWLYQIARNEIKDFLNEELKPARDIEQLSTNNVQRQQQAAKPFCCLDKFIDELPEIFKVVIEQIYIEGKTQKETAGILKISLANVKIRVNRAKSILKSRFNECCHYGIDKNGKLTGEPDCERCYSVLNCR